MTQRPLCIASRGSDLALWQSRTVLAALERSAATRRSWSRDITIIQTRGDLDQSPILAGQMEKGFFTVELEQALRAGSVDLVIHSLKDLPTSDAPNLTTRTVLPRANAADLLIVQREFVADQGAALPLKPGARVGASSLRRIAMLREFAPQAVSAPLRGNVPTRVRRLGEGRVDAIVIAAAGIERLGLDLSAFATFELDPTHWVPAPGQGALAAQCRANDSATIAEIEALTNPDCQRATAWERDFLRVIEGGCATPFGCHVVGSTAYIGIDTPLGFRQQTIALPSHHEGTEREHFIRTCIGQGFESARQREPGVAIARAR